MVRRLCARGPAENRPVRAGGEWRIRCAVCGSHRTQGIGLLPAGQSRAGSRAGPGRERNGRRERLMGEFLSRLWEALTRRIDNFLFGCAFALVGVGLVTLFSASDQSVARVTTQVLSLGFALVLMWVVANIPPQTLARTAVPLYVLGVLLLVGVALFGVMVNGSRRWLNFGVARIQPS